MKSIAMIILGLGMALSVAAREGTLLSDQGSGRATAYLESPKIVTFEGKTHVAWLDSSEEGFRVCIRSLDRESGIWSERYTIGEAEDNHGGPALTVDAEGYLHVIYYAHHHPVRYRKSVRPNDASQWSEYIPFGRDLTYPALLCAPDGTLVLAARRSYEDKPWELEMWRKEPDGDWERQGAVLRSRHGIYAQFAASLAWGADRRTLHLATRIYELPEDELEQPLTTVGYLKSEDGGRSWSRSDGAPVSLPATAETLDVIASGRGREGRILNAGSLAIGPDGLPYVPYSVRTEDSSQAYLARPYGNGKWRHRHLNPYLPEEVRDWALFMHGGVAFGEAGQPVVTAVAMQVEPLAPDWGDPSSEAVCFRSEDGGESFAGNLLGRIDPETPSWMPNMERPTGFNEMGAYPSFVYTVGARGDSLSDRLSNEVWWVPTE
ncbi:BNR-4 repeat-containing protein [Pelagicoccus sp. SDUM812005]|uniref:BNR-4 repeat-containing protein n=1 Tax=Pelagicoccus sp. SDUM812005 TaxID=3041257 RepID=UPI00280CBB83|nr:BNR-4 repeat-containing protein [Pelagicoccus sp. SDUM812005]MDQ8183659.1 BNR-4 repeat-containing protein [Pelagicoccus sp. SDUM812005]